MRFRHLLLAATTLALPFVAMPAAQAQISGLYIGSAAGMGFGGQVTTKNRPVGRYSDDPSQATNTFGKGFLGNFNAGFAGLANFGYGFGNGFRAEIEGFYQANGVSNVVMYRSQYTGNLATNAGTLRTFGFMLNGYYDVDPNFFPSGARFFQPYIGVGIGYGYSQLQGVRPREPNQNNNNQPQTNYLEADVSRGGGNVAFQGIVGAAFAIDSVAPGLAVTAEYRYRGSLGVPLNAKAYQVNTNSGQGTERRLASHDSFRPSFGGSQVLLGVRYALEAEDMRPAPATNLPVGWVPPAMPAARTYMVFFANNSAALDAAARQVVAEAVQSARTVATTSIQLAGHADGTGRSPRNQQLSQERVRAVTAELARLGVPRNAISGSATGAMGSSGADAQARRVDITLR